jgi:type I restriction enzyme S subunit
MNKADGQDAGAAGRGVPRGYKQTEVGVIPEDWIVRPLGEIVDFLDGRRRPVKDSDRSKMRGTIPYYGASGIVDYVNSHLFDEDLILLGEDGENIVSRNCRLAFRISGKTWVNNHAHVLRPKSDTSLGFLVEYLESLSYEQYNSGTAQPKLNKQTCLRIPIALPPTETEQAAIAEALSDADALIESLAQLLAKKRALKLGAMQELLTGKKRLSGFNGAWRTVQMRSVLTQPATYGIVTAGTFVQAGVKMLRGGDIHDGQINLDLPMVTSEKAAEYVRTRLVKDDVVVALVGYPGDAAVIPEFLVGANISRAVGLLRLNGAVLPHYLVCFLNSPDGRRMVLAPSAGSAQQVVNLAALNKLEFELPTIDEQAAIATVIMDINNEITVLESKLTKARQLKQGMMQALLTGRIRLI